MWLTMTDTYISGNGSFFKGIKYDLPLDIIKLLPKGCYKKCCAPWEEQKDKKSLQLIEAKAKAKDARVWADVLQSKADEAMQKADQFVHPASQKQEQAQAAKAAADKATKEAQKKDASDKAKRHAYGLVREYERKNLESQKAHGRLRVALAEVGLKRMEAEDAKRQAETTARQLQELEAKQTKAKAKAKAKAEAEAKTEKQAEKKTEAEDGNAEPKTKEQAEAGNDKAKGDKQVTEG